MKETVRNQLILDIKKRILSSPDLTKLTNEEVRELAERLLEEKRREAVSVNNIDVISMNFVDKKFILDGVFESIRGLGVLGQIIADPSITEVMINGFEDIFVEREGDLKKLDNKFESKEQLTNIITRFVSDAGRVVNESEPIVDTRLADGSRVNVVVAPVALNGPIVTIRRFSKDPMTIEKLIAYGSITPEIADFLEMLVKAKYNIFVSGGTGSGKTTFLNALSNFIPKNERIITIEDSAELQIKNIENIVRLETKNAGADGTGAVTIKDLIKSSLRMRPERIIVGEVRGAEALDMLQAMNTGHDGSLSTGHANSTEDMLSRLETMILQGASGLPLEAIRQQIASGVDVIVHLSRMRDKSRKTVEITEILGYNYEKRKVDLNTLYKFEIDESKSSKDEVAGGLKKKNDLIHTEKLERSGFLLADRA